MKVMIVDDQAPMRALIRESLRLPSVEIVECASGAEAVTQYDLTLPDWVAMDCRMEPMDGITALSRIRSRNPEARIIVVSSWDEPELREAARDAGALAYVLKDELHRINELICRGASHEP
jgi:DNA-binding NarL/FixJ family response regulator